MIESQVSERHQPRWQSVLLFIAGFAVTPFAITGWYRIGFDLGPFALEMALPVFLVVAIGLYLYFRTSLRPLAVGAVAGALAWAAFLMWLLYRWGSGPQIP